MNSPAVLKVEVVAASLTQRLQLAPTVIAGKVVALDTEAEKAMAVAERAVVNNAVEAGKVADIIRAINVQLRKCEEHRTPHTEPLDVAKKQIMDLFRVPFLKLEKAKTLLNAKAGKWRRAEEARLTQLAEEARIQKQEAAKLAAAAQAALGDTQGAQQIVEEAAALPVQVGRAVAVGSYGASLGGRKRSVGKVTDLRAFLTELLGTGDPLLLAVLDEIEIPKSALNRIAAAVHKGETLKPNGFEAVEEDSNVVR